MIGWRRQNGEKGCQAWVKELPLAEVVKEAVQQAAETPGNTPSDEVKTPLRKP
jgi:hypothetical protein